MKTSKILQIGLLTAFLGISQISFAQWNDPFGSTNQGNAVLSTENNAAKSIVWDKTSHDFGDIKQNNAQMVEYKFTNNSGKPILINKAEASCGCTKLTYDKAPIMPGKTGTISTVYDAKEEGLFQKSITVYFSLEAPYDVYELKLTGNVVK